MASRIKESGYRRLLTLISDAAFILILNSLLVLPIKENPVGRPHVTVYMLFCSSRSFFCHTQDLHH